MLFSKKHVVTDIEGDLSRHRSLQIILAQYLQYLYNSLKNINMNERRSKTFEIGFKIKKSCDCFCFSEHFTGFDSCRRETRGVLFTRVIDYPVSELSRKVCVR